MTTVAFIGLVLAWIHAQFVIRRLGILLEEGKALLQMWEQQARDTTAWQDRVIDDWTRINDRDHVRIEALLTVLRAVREDLKHWEGSHSWGAVNAILEKEERFGPMFSSMRDVQPK